MTPFVYRCLQSAINGGPLDLRFTRDREGWLCYHESYPEVEGRGDTLLLAMSSWLIEASLDPELGAGKEGAK